MDHALQCRCGRLRGVLAMPEKAVRAVCYCIDCQTSAHFLGAAATTLDALGGTEVVATRARFLRFTAGQEALACHSLSERGLLRWHAGCCRTPVANTTRDPRLPYVGLVHTVLGDAGAIQRDFGPVRMRVNTQTAREPVPASRLSIVRGLLGIAPGLLADRLGSGWRLTPFFDETGHAVRAPQVLSQAERETARQAAQQGPAPSPAPR